MTRLNERLRAALPPLVRPARAVPLACEGLETRSLLSLAPILSIPAGTVHLPHQTATVELPITPGRFTPGPSGKIIFEVEVKPIAGDHFVPGFVQIIAPNGKAVAAQATRSGDAVFVQAALKPGDYRVRVNGLGSSTGSFDVAAGMAGDVQGDRLVNQADLSAIRQGEGTRAGQPGYNAALDVNSSGSVTAADMALATYNLGSNAQYTMNFLVQDNTKGQFAPDQVYVAILGKDSGGNFAHLTAGGSLVPMKVSDNTAPGHLTKDGKNYSNYFIRLSDLPAGFTVPVMNSGRVYIALGSPLYITVNTDVDKKIGYAGPNVENATDPNLKVYFDTIEFTTDGSGFHGNTTQVDEFGFPMTMKLASTDGTTGTVGITESRAAIFSEFRTTANLADFQGLLSQAPYRILAPKHSTYSQSKNPTYFDNYIAQVWSHYSATDLVLTNSFVTFTGRVINNVFTFTRPGDSNRYLIHRPATWEVFGSAGVFASGGEIEKALEAQLDAAMNRHVALTPGDFNAVGRYYQAAPANFYAAFWHPRSIAGLAYGFDYDDVNNQSSSLKSTDPKSLTISVTWN